MQCSLSDSTYRSWRIKCHGKRRLCMNQLPSLEREPRPNRRVLISFPRGCVDACSSSLSRGGPCPLGTKTHTESQSGLLFGNRQQQIAQHSNEVYTRSFHTSVSPLETFSHFDLRSFRRTRHNTSRSPNPSLCFISRHFFQASTDHTHNHTHRHHHHHHRHVRRSRSPRLAHGPRHPDPVASYR